jgi:hypothetical protein
MSQKPCTILRDALAVYPAGSETIDSPLIDVFNLQDIKCANPMIVYSEDALAGAEIIARTLRNSVCGFSKTFGNGSFTHLGTWIGFDTEGQKPVYEALLNRSGARLRQADAANPNFAIRERFTGNNEALVFIANYYNEEHSGNVSYTHPENGETINLPYTRNEMLLPPIYGILSPVCLEVSDGLKILHSTSDILNIDDANGQLQLTLYGDRDLVGEIVFEGSGIKKISPATLEGNTIEPVVDQSRIAYSYKHIHKSEMILTIKLR